MTRRASPDQLPGVSAGSATKVPEGPQTLQAARRRVAGDQRGIQGEVPASRSGTTLASSSAS